MQDEGSAGFGEEVNSGGEFRGRSGVECEVSCGFLRSVGCALSPRLGVSEDRRVPCAGGFVRLQGQLAIAHFPGHGNNSKP